MPRQKSRHVDDPRAVGERLKAARERAGLSQRQLAFSGCSPAYISRIEAGERIPSLQLLRELGRRLGVSEDFLATGSEAPPGSSPLAEAELALRLDELDVAEQLYQQVADDAVTARARGEALEGLGQLAVRRGEPRQAVALFEQALESLGVDVCDRPTLAESLGRSYASLGDYAPAIATFERCLRRFDERGERVELVRFACLLGYALTDSGDFSRAEQVVAKALADGGELRDPYTRARLYWSQSKLRGERGDSDGAADYAQRALALLQLTEDTHYIALAHQLLASVELDRGRVEEALEHLDEARPLLEITGTPVEQAKLGVEEARALAIAGRDEEAAALALSLAGKLNNADANEAGRIYTLVADVFTSLGDPARAKELYELAIDYLQPNNPSTYLAEVYGKLADLLEAEGRESEAYGYMKQALRIQQAVAARAPVSAASTEV